MFGANTSNAKVVRAGNAYITVGGATMYAIGVQIQFQRTAQILPTLSKDRIIAIGEPQGTLTIDSLVMSDSRLPSQITSGDCKLDSITVTYSAAGNNCQQGTKTVTCKNGVASAVSLTGNGSQGYIAQGFTFTFTDMQLG